jgi:protoheme IX farnesyltransferase
MLYKDYTRAAVPVLPVVAGEALTRRWVLQTSILLLAGSLLPFATGLGSPFYLAAAVILGGRFVWMAWVLERRPERIRSVQLYKYSLLYLALIFMALAADRILYMTILR